MAQDQQSYRRAANAALVGLIVQILLTVAMGLAGLKGQSPPLYAATWHLLGGLPIWIVLFLLYHQHGLERAEALETERLSRSDQQAANIFEEHADDLQLARRRLNNLYKWGLGVVSVLVAVYLLTMGGVLLWLANRAHNRNILIENSFKGEDVLLLAAGTAAIMFVAFIAARYVAGMTKVPQWGVLRGGAAYLMGGAVIALLCALGLFLRGMFDRPGFLAILTYVIPAIMLLQGVEVLLTFLLNAYRPRRPGEIPRPAFDSRLLGLLTSPKSLAKAMSDAINYQFGFEVSKSWFYQLLGRAITPLVLFAILVLILISSIVVVQPHQRAIITRMGAYVTDEKGNPEVFGPGIHFKLPWPLGGAETYDVGRVLQISIGSAAGGINPEASILWTTQHAAGGAAEEYLVTAPTTPAQGADTDTARSPVALIGMQMVVQYRIKENELGNFIHRAGTQEHAQDLIKRIAERRLTHYLVTQETDALLGAGRIEASDALKQNIQADIDAAKVGLEVVYVAMIGVHPPSDGDVAASFHQQISVLQEVQGIKEDAQKDRIRILAEVAGSEAQAAAISEAISGLNATRNRLEALRRDPSAATPEQVQALEKQLLEREAAVEELLAKASGEAASLLYAARADRWSRALGDRSRAQLFLAELEAYRQAPSLYRTRRYLDVLAEGLSGNSRKIIVASQQPQLPLIRVDLTDAGSAVESLLRNNP